MFNNVVLKSILFHILEQCSEMNTFQYCQHLDWRYLSEKEMSHVYGKNSYMEELAMNGFVVRRSSLSYELDREDESGLRLRIQSAGLVKLIFHCHVSDTILQTIFQHLVRYGNNSCVNYSF